VTTHPQEQSSSPTGASAKRLGRFFSLPYLILYPALVLPPLLGLLLFILVVSLALLPKTHVGDFDLNEYVHTCEDARARILPGGIPTSAHNFWLYEFANWNGRVTYWVFDCGSREDCIKALQCTGTIRRGDLKPWKPSHYAVAMEGPAFYSTHILYSKPLSKSPWDVRRIENGLVYEQVLGENDTMTYFAIDLDRNRVFCHEERGGFPPDRYRPQGAKERGQQKPE
jgi:hypothetical protein